jgi:hypothetical protein
MNTSEEAKMYAPGNNGTGRTRAQEEYRNGYYDAKHRRPFTPPESPRWREHYTRGFDQGFAARRA